MPMTLTDAEVAKLQVVLKSLKKQQERWCGKEVDDPEDMWSDIPEMLDEVVPVMEGVFGK